ncbi:putative transporter [compost metagenome]
MAALVGVMFMVSISTFDWRSLTSLNRVPRADTLVMIVTVVTVVATDNLSIGVLVGVLLSALSFAWKMANITVTAKEEKEHKIYFVSGQLFFGTTSHFLQAFGGESDPGDIVIDFSASHIWDQSAALAISKTIDKYALYGKKVTITGMNEESSRLVGRIGMEASGGH